MDSRTIFGVLGNLTAFIVFLLPARAIYKNRRGRSRDSSPSSFMYRYHAAMISCLLWILNGDRFMGTINGIGFVMEFFYLGLFLLTTRTFMDMLKHYAIVLFEFCCFFLLAHLALTFDDPAKFAGTVCLIGNVLLCVMKMVWGTKRQPIHESAASFANGVIWSAYGFISSDIFILVPNVVESVRGLIKLMQYGICYRSALQVWRQNAEEMITVHTEENSDTETICIEVIF